MRRLNISIDDVSPHPMSGPGVIDKCFRVLEHYPDAKFTLFVPTAYWRTMHIVGRPDTRTTQPLYLKDHPWFCEKLKELPQDSFEVGFHGRHHGIPGVSNNDEFRNVDDHQYGVLVDQMWKDVVEAKCVDVFEKRLFRPPAMYMSPPAIKTSEAFFNCLALSPRSYHKKVYAGADEDDDGIQIVYANMWFPDDSLDRAPEGDLELLYHACEWDGGYFDDSRVDELLAWLDSNPVEFCFIEGIRG